MALIPNAIPAHPASSPHVLVLNSDNGRAESVSYAPIEFTDPRGVQWVYARIKLAASDVCGWPRPRDQKGRLEQFECEAGAIADAVAHVDNALLTAFWSFSTSLQTPVRL